ncbi:MAG: MBOAT family protein [Bacteroidetes bacterium]|nr:MBOAT family protein [Bacteroidota bacterium]
MIFNSIHFLIFFTVVFSLYYFVLKERTKPQNVLLLIASYVFYAWANWKILPLLAVTTAIFYGLGIASFEAKTDKRKSLFTALGVVFGIGTLLYFKYFNFFITSFKDLFEFFGLQTNLHTFKIIVPIGISFYTFRLLSYIIDIQRGKIEPTRDIIAFSTYVAFFPCILSGPIDRPATLIPQLQSTRAFDYSLAVDGVRQILWGLFKKVVIADNLAVYVNQVFENYQDQSGSALLIAAVFYSFQLYADFSGYTDMAIGVSKVLGFRVTKNFDFPYFAQNIAEFWRKWHISLTAWLTDYVFMPLNIKWRNWGKWGMILAIVVNFVLCGLWHGDNWTFVLWGFYHGLLFIPLILSGAMFKKNKIETYKWDFPKPKIVLTILLTFALWTLGLVLFRSESVGQAFEFLGGMIQFDTLRATYLMFILKDTWAIWFVLFMLVVEWAQRKKEHGLETLGFSWNKWLRYTFYFVLAFTICLYSLKGESPDFIYFQF